MPLLLLLALGSLCSRGVVGERETEPNPPAARHSGARSMRTTDQGHSTSIMPWALQTRNNRCVARVHSGRSERAGPANANSNRDKAKGLMMVTEPPLAYKIIRVLWLSIVFPFVFTIICSAVFTIIVFSNSVYYYFFNYFHYYYLYCCGILNVIHYISWTEVNYR